MRARLSLEHTTITSFDGTPIGVQQAGNPSAPALLLANGIGVTVAGYRHLIEHFRDRFRFVSWDYRGLHSSGRPVRGYDALSVEDHARDAVAVVDALGIERFHALGWSLGVQVLLEMQRLAAHRTLTLVLHNGVAGRVFESLGRTGILTKLAAPALEKLQRIDGVVEGVVARFLKWERGVDVAIRAGFLHKDVDRALFNDVIAGDFMRIDMHICFEILRRLGTHDASDVLPTLRSPTLIVQATADRMTPLRVAERMATAIPGAQLEVLQGGSHYAAVEMPGVFHGHLERFWRAAGVLT